MRRKPWPMKPAKIAGEAPYRVLEGSQRQGSRGGRTAEMYVPPPLPADFDEANCTVSTPKERDELWFLADSAANETLAVSDARDFLWKKYCADCPVLERCYKWAMAYEIWGIWAGTTEFDRKRARKDPELLEAGLNRIRAGYKPFAAKRCPMCGKGIKPTSRHCTDCSKKDNYRRRKEAAAKYERLGMPAKLAVDAAKREEFIESRNAWKVQAEGRREHRNVSSQAAYGMVEKYNRRIGRITRRMKAWHAASRH